jgi:hypothetical protein
LLGVCRGGKDGLTDLFLTSHFKELLLPILIRIIDLTKEDQPLQSWILQIDHSEYDLTPDRQVKLGFQNVKSAPQPFPCTILFIQH